MLSFHEIAHVVNLTCRVVYMDVDPVVVECNRLHAGLAPGAESSLRTSASIEAVLYDPVARSLLDLQEPVNILMGAVLHHIPDSDHRQRGRALLRAARGRMLLGGLTRCG
ncbi:hypothetical protein FKR81_37545 [Lentzea tibetensis]|uniref:Uncharacterized protein n=1 Tax=Lentzea tibetensis TaxID=2591470 RepID=A0A563EHJ2_9PSEU|nr:hypothetical protein FKR81_37545 [Lentzea tibetensis]